jgi:hypothetical protein
MKLLRDSAQNIEDKIIINSDLTIVFTRDNGKFVAKYNAVIEDGQCVGYKRSDVKECSKINIESNTQI